MAAYVSPPHPEGWSSKIDTELEASLGNMMNPNPNPFLISYGDRNWAQGLIYARHIKTPIFKDKTHVNNHIWLLILKIFILFNHESSMTKFYVTSHSHRRSEMYASLSVCLLLLKNKRNLMWVSSELSQNIVTTSEKEPNVGTSICDSSYSLNWN